jgi:selenocysteine-specific elongation factor
MGTAGHIDHGKTALIKALTNIDCDTHKEEKRRGITINLGFSHLELPSGDSIGIVDVPGHKDFVNTMVGGASGIDFVLMVIAADSGVMPQTREHLQIMEILGIRHGLIALTKIDLIDDPQLLEISKLEITEFVKGTFLEHCPIIEISSKTKQGLGQLIQQISTIIPKIEEKPCQGVFRMFIDRVFSISGFGTVVTGSVISGTIRLKDKLFLLPGKSNEFIIRRLERHGREVPMVKAGDRASINIVGAAKEIFKKGMVIADRPLQESLLLDGKLTLFANSQKLKTWSQVIFHAGTFESLAKIHLIDKNKLDQKDNALVQIQLQNPSIFQFGDRFVIRNSSSDLTLGGGKIIDISPLFHRRRPEKLIHEMSVIAAGKLNELIAAEVKKHLKAFFIEEMALKLNTSVRVIEQGILHKLPKDVRIYKINRQTIFISTQRQDLISQGIFSKLTDFKTQNPLIRRGISFEEIKSALKIPTGSADEEVLAQILFNQTQTGKLVETNKSWRLADDFPTADEATASHMEFFSRYLERFAMKIPLWSEIIEAGKKRNLSEKDVKQILYNLKTAGTIQRVKDDYIHNAIVNFARKKLIANFATKEDGFSIAEFREIINGNRRICLLLLTIFDHEGLTKRQGDLRILIK